MLISVYQEFIGRLLGWRRSPNARRRAGNQMPSVEGLEDRSLLTTFVVTTAADVVDPNDNFLSLREAIEASNLNFVADDISFSGALFGVPIRVTAGQLVISGPLTISGFGASNTVIDTQGTSRVFAITGANGNAGDVTFRTLTVTGGRTTFQTGVGAGIDYQASGTLTLIDVEVTGNTTTGNEGRGAGIAADFGDVVLVRSTVAGNSTSGENAVGAGIGMLNGNLTLINSTVSGNSTSNNFAGGAGIGTLNTNVVLTNSTVTLNRALGAASSAGGGIFSAGSGGFLTLNNSIVAGNSSASSTAEDISSSNGTAASHSLIGVADGSGLEPSPPDSIDFFGNFVGTAADPFDPKLGSLAFNGGRTRTHRLLNSSLAVNAGQNQLARDQNGNTLFDDQALQQRIFDGIVDMGSYELQTVITDPFVRFELGAQSVTEGAGVFELTVVLSQPTVRDVTVQFVASGTAARDTDYLVTIGTILIPAGSTEARIEVTILDDIADEIDEIVVFELRRPQNATLGDPFTDTLTIVDNDGNEAGGPTNITLSSNLVNENIANTVVSTLTAPDPNVGDTATFTILPGGQGDQFVITGKQLKVGSSGLDFESITDGVALVNVRATDSTGKSFIKQLRITVGDLNEAPVVPDNQTFFVPEDAVTDFVVGIVEATDPDTTPANSTHKFSIIGGNIGNAFKIAIGNGEIRVANPAALNAETNPVFSLLIQVTDLGTPALSTTQFMTIEVTDANEAPVIVPSQILSVDENPGNGTFVGTIVASDPDPTAPNSTLTYSIIGGNTNNAFAVDPSTGEVTVSNASQLTLANGTSYALQTLVEDGGNPSLSDIGTVTVTVVDVNQPPTIPAGQSFNLNENPSNGQIVGTVAASDPDPTAPNNILTYTIAGGTTGGAFAIDATTGLITVNVPAAVNFETSPQFNLQIRVTDGGSPARSVLRPVTVTLNDVNDAPIIADDQEFSVSEAATTGTVIGTVIGSDPDAMSPGNQASFSISGGNVGNTFAIDPTTGQLTVSSGATFDHETTSSYTLLITLTDDLGLETIESITINVIDVNEAPILGNSGSPPTYIRGQTKKLAILPNITVSDPDSTTDLSEIRISLPVPPGTRNLDKLLLKGAKQIGRVTDNTTNDRREITITLKSGITTSEVQAFLRTIVFSTRKGGLSLNHRDIQVQVIDRQGAASNVITQDISVQS